MIFSNAVFCMSFFIFISINRISSQVYRIFHWMKISRYPLPRPCPKMLTTEGLVIHLPSSNVYQFGSTSYFLMRFSAVVSLLPSLYIQSIHKFIEMVLDEKNTLSIAAPVSENTHNRRFSISSFKFKRV